MVFTFGRDTFFMKRFLLLSLSLFSVYALCAQSGTEAKKIVADKIAAVVGDRIIMYSDIKNTIADYVRQGAQIPQDAECQILDQAILSKVLMQQAEKDSLPVTDEEVDADLELRVREFVRMYGTEKAVEELAGKSIYQIKEDARESVREKKLAEAEQKKIVDNIKITPAEAKVFFDRVPKDSLPFLESQLEVGQIVVYPKASRDLEQYVIDELNHYRQLFEAKTSTFEQLAKLYSSGVSPEAMREGKAAEFAALLRDLQALDARFKVKSSLAAALAGEPNNARLASLATYYDCVPGFERVLEAQQHDLPRFYAAVRELAKLPREARRERLCAAP